MSDKQRLQVNNTNLLDHLSNIMALPIGNLYAGNNPLTIGEEGATIPANTLLKEALQIINGVEPGVTGIDYGIVKPVGFTTELTVNHNLGAVPSKVWLIAERNLSDSSYTTLVTDQSIIQGGSLYYLSNVGVTAPEKTASQITFHSSMSKNFCTSYNYYWFAIA